MSAEYNTIIKRWLRHLIRGNAPIRFHPMSCPWSITNACPICRVQHRNSSLRPEPASNISSLIPDWRYQPWSLKPYARDFPPARILFLLANPTLTVLVQTTADVGPAYLQHAKRRSLAGKYGLLGFLGVVAFMKQGGCPDGRKGREEFGI